MKPRLPKAAKPQQVRIIGGRWKRTPLAVVEAEGLRPTPDRVRETVFNWLGHLLGGGWSGVSCLDLFAGTGAFGFEAASRGAAQVMLVEMHPAALRQLDVAREKLGAEQVTVMRGDALLVAQRLAAAGQRFDVVFLDPPYSSNGLERALPASRALLKDDGLIYVESPHPLDRFGSDEIPGWMQGWEIVRSDRAGMVSYNLLRKTDNA